jgi:hypothetical protein
MRVIREFSYVTSISSFKETDFQFSYSKIYFVIEEIVFNFLIFNFEEHYKKLQIKADAIGLTQRTTDELPRILSFLSFLYFFFRRQQALIDALRPTMAGTFADMGSYPVQLGKMYEFSLDEFRENDVEEDTNWDEHFGQEFSEKILKHVPEEKENEYENVPGHLVGNVEEEKRGMTDIIDHGAEEESLDEIDKGIIPNGMDKIDERSPSLPDIRGTPSMETYFISPRHSIRGVLNYSRTPSTISKSSPINIRSCESVRYPETIFMDRDEVQFTKPSLRSVSYRL